MRTINPDYLRCRSNQLLLSASGWVLASMLAANAQIELPAVRVQNDQNGRYQATEAGLAKLSEPLLNTPISVDSITSQLIQDRGETTLNDALRNAPGVTLAAGEFNWEGNAPYIRGFSARTDMFVDGMRDVGDYFRDPFSLEQVEVLEGPDSILFGRGSTGGVINQVAKKPFLGTLAAVSGTLGTDGTERLTADLNTDLDGLGAPAAARFNLMGNSAGVAGRDVVHNDRYGADGSLAWGLGTPTRLSIEYFHQSENDQPDYGLPWYFGKPAPVARNVYYGYRDSDYSKLRADIVTGEAERDFGGDVTLRARVRYADYPRNVQIAKAMEPAGLTMASPLSSINVNINSYTLNSTEREFENQSDLSARFQTGVISHSLVAGLEYDSESSDPNYYNSTGQSPKSLMSPDENQAFNPTATFPRVFAVTKTSTVGVYALDTMKLGEDLQAIASIRWDSFAASFSNSTFAVPPAPTNVVIATNAQHRVDQELSPRVALVYKPVTNGTFYFSYGTSFNPTAEALNFINSGENYNVANEALKPEESTNLEVGTKWQVLEDKLSLTAALFRTEMANARIPDPNNPGFNMLAGDQRVDGYELQAQGTLLPGWNISLGFDYLNSDTIKTSAGGPPLGFPLPFTPRGSATAWSTYQILQNLQIGFGGQYEGARFAQTTNPIERASGYLVVDAMAKYRLGEKFDIQANIYNLTDKYYYDLLHPAFVVPGAGRSATVTLSYHL